MAEGAGAEVPPKPHPSGNRSSAWRAHSWGQVPSAVLTKASENGAEAERTLRGLRSGLSGICSVGLLVAVYLWMTEGNINQERS